MTILRQSTERLLTLQQRRHAELTKTLARIGQQRDEALLKLSKLDAKYREIAAKVGRSGKRLVETKNVFHEPVAKIVPPTIKTRKVSDLNDDLGALLGGAR